MLTTERAKAVAQLDRARAVEQQAALNLSYTRITAPVDGTVGARSLRVGQYVQAGTQLMAVVPLDAVYVVANFKETQLTHVRNGQPVEIAIDSFHGATLRGHVDSLSPASGLEFALLPPDNATGNFTKIVQRVPVKIVLDDQQPDRPAAPGHVGGADHQHQGDRLAERESKARVASDIAAQPERRLRRHVRQDYQAPLDNPFAPSRIIETRRLMHPASASQEETTMTALPPALSRFHQPRCLARRARRRADGRRQRSPQRPGSR